MRRQLADRAGKVDIANLPRAVVIMDDIIDGHRLAVRLDDLGFNLRAVLDLLLDGASRPLLCCPARARGPLTDHTAAARAGLRRRLLDQTPPPTEAERDPSRRPRGQSRRRVALGIIFATAALVIIPACAPSAGAPALHDS